MRLRPFLAAALLGAALQVGGALGCRDATPPAAESLVNLASVLPKGPAYITGTVVERGSRLGAEPSVLVATNPLNPQADPLDGTGDRSAHVVLGAGVTVVHRDGRRAGVDDLKPGRMVTAWVGATELRSLPPVVVGRVLVIEP